MQELNLIGKLSNGGSYLPVIEPKTITENGTYTAPEGVDGYNPINIRVSDGGAVIESKTITENGTYTAPEGVDGYSPIDVLVTPLLEDRYINANGQYVPTEGYDGIRRLTVEVPVPTITPVTLTENGTYTDSSGNGHNPITVAVPTVNNMTNNFTQRTGGAMTITYKLNGIDITWNGGDDIPCALSSFQDIKSKSKLDVILTTGTSYYSTHGAHVLRELYVGLTSTYYAPTIYPTNVNWLEHQQVHDDNTTYTFSFDLTEIEATNIYLYISANGWNITDMQISLS